MAANPIQIVPLHTAALAPVATPQLTYRGGAVLGNVQVFVFYWGGAWSQPDQAPIAQHIDAFFDYVLSSVLMDQLAEYGTPTTPIGHGSRMGSLTLTAAPPATVADTDVQQLIQSEISSDSAVPQPTANTLYFVFLPPGVTVGLSGGSSCVNFCGYHSDIGGQVFYAVMPYPDCSGCQAGLAVGDALTQTASHELCEAVTDPVPGQGWYDDQNGEIGDICAWQTKQLGGYEVQLEWSNRAGRCV